MMLVELRGSVRDGIEYAFSDHKAVCDTVAILVEDRIIKPENLLPIARKIRDPVCVRSVSSISPARSVPALLSSGLSSLSSHSISLLL